MGTEMGSELGAGVGVGWLRLDGNKVFLVQERLV